MKIVVDVVNSEKVKQLTEEIKRQEQEILKWNSAMATAGPKQKAALETAMMSAAMTIRSANLEIKELSKTAVSSSRNLSQLAYACDDLQYGFNAIVNNIPGIVMGLGGGAGIAGVAGIAAVAINQLVKHAGDLADAFNSWNSGRPTEVLREIREQAEAAAEALEKIPNITEREAKREAGVGKLIQNEPKQKFISEIMDALGTDEKKVERYKKYYEAKDDLLHPGRLKGLESKDERDFRMLQIEKSAKEAEETERRERAEKLAGKALLGGQAGEQGIKDLQDLLPKHKERLGNLARGIDPEEIAKKTEARKEAEHQTDMAARKEQEKMFEVERTEQEKADHEREKQNELEIKGRHNARESDKKTRIDSLEAERKAVEHTQREFDDKMFYRQQKAGEHGQIMQGARAATDYYQTGSRGDDAKALAKEAHEQRKKTNERLESIDESLKKERRLVIPR